MNENRSSVTSMIYRPTLEDFWSNAPRGNVDLTRRDQLPITLSTWKMEPLPKEIIFKQSPDIHRLKVEEILCVSFVVFGAVANFPVISDRRFLFRWNCDYKTISKYPKNWFAFIHQINSVIHTTVMRADLRFGFSVFVQRRLTAFHGSLWHSIHPTGVSLRLTSCESITGSVYPANCCQR